MHRLYTLLSIALMLVGCGMPRATDSDDLIVVVAGAGGHGAGHNKFLQALRDGGCDSNFEYFNWGAPLPLFAVNFSNDSIHRNAETDLANKISSLHRPVQIVAHSAGCGVALGAMARVDNSAKVERVILLAPSVSPDYDITPAIKHVGEVHLFYSASDNVFLSWRTSHFGTYDNVKTKAAGNLGLTARNPKLFQHKYEGGHFATLEPDFATEFVAPLLAPRAGDHPR